MPTRVLALDPGDRVGWARAIVHENGLWEDLRHGISPLRDMAIAVHDSLVDPPDLAGAAYDVVVIEDWRLRPGMEKSFIGSAFPSSQFIGAVKLCCWLSGTKLVTQQPANKPTALKTAKVLRPELYAKMTQPIRHDDGHDLDALMHLWFYTFKNCDFPIVQQQEAA